MKLALIVACAALLLGRLTVKAWRNHQRWAKPNGHDTGFGRLDEKQRKGFVRRYGE